MTVAERTFKLAEIPDKIPVISAVTTDDFAVVKVVECEAKTKDILQLWS